MSDLTSQYIIAQEEHDYNKKYEKGSIVKHTIDNITTAYAAKKNVPQFISILNKNYWKKIASTTGSGGSVDIFDENVEATDAQRNKALANVSNQTANSTTGKMGYKVLDPSKTFAEQVTAENTIYEIKDVFDLGGTQETPVSVTLPAGSTLKVNGGIIKNCTLHGNNSIINAEYHKIFDNVQFTGTWNCRFISDWFLSVGLADYTTELTYMFNCGIPNIYFTYNHVYNVIDTIVINDDIVIGSLSESKTPIDTKTIINCSSYKTVIHYKHTGNYTIPVNIGGISVKSGDGRTSSTVEPDYTTPIVYVELTSGSALWGGAKIYFDISCNNTYQYVDGVQYNRLTMTGLHIQSTGGTGSFIEIDGRITAFCGIKISKSSNGWINDTHIQSITQCCYGGMFQIGAPIYISGSHQTCIFPISLDTTNTYFNGNGTVQVDGYVWDLNNIASDNLKSVKYAFENPKLAIQKRKFNSNIPNIGNTLTDFLINDPEGFLIKNESSFDSFSIEVAQDNVIQDISKDDVIQLNNLFNINCFPSGGVVNRDEYRMQPFLSKEKTLLLDTSKPIHVSYTFEIKDSCIAYIRGYSSTNMAYKVSFYSKNSISDEYVLEEEFNPTMNENANNKRLLYVPLVSEKQYLKIKIEYDISSLGYMFSGGGYMYHLIPFNLINYTHSIKPILDSYISRTECQILPGRYTSSSLYLNPNTHYLARGLGFDCNSSLSVEIDGYTEDQTNHNIVNPFTIKITSSQIYANNIHNAFRVYQKTSEKTDYIHYEILIDYTVVFITKINARGFLLSSLKPYNSAIESDSDATRRTDITYIRSYGSTSNSPTNLETKLTGKQYFNTTIGRPGYWNGSKFVDSDGFTLAAKSGTTRPTLTENDAGCQFFDTTLGKYICWNGSAWINLDGTSLS